MYGSQHDVGKMRMPQVTQELDSAPGLGSRPTASADVSVVLCAYTEERWNDLLAAVRSIQEQSIAAREIIVVIDNNPKLLAQVRAAMPDVMAVENNGGRGAGEARNRGVNLATGSIIAFLDDDAIATPSWIEYATAGCPKSSTGPWAAPIPGCRPHRPRSAT
jgi:glycosyltransferase involved in cell wall biosynthesis